MSIALDSLAVIGCGNMGAALLRGVVAKGLIPKTHIFIYDADSQKMQELAEELAVNSCTSLEEACENAHYVICAIKPQVFPDQVSRFKAREGGSVFISIMAGLHSHKMKSKLEEGFSVVRTMPNLPLSVFEGATAIETDGLSEDILANVEKIFNSSGKSVRVEGHQLDAVTGLSGSGPMYVFEFADGMIEAGKSLGLSPEVSKNLALQTIRGALMLLENSDLSPGQWTQKVCSPGGTTLKGLEQLENNQFKDIIIKAITAAKNRSVELGNS